MHRYALTAAAIAAMVWMEERQRARKPLAGAITIDATPDVEGDEVTVHWTEKLKKIGA